MMVYSDGVTGNGGMERQTDRQTDRQGHRERDREKETAVTGRVLGRFSRLCRVLGRCGRLMSCIRTVWQPNAVYKDGVAG